MRTLALAAALLAASSALADELDEDFAPAPTRSLALGPVRAGGLLLSVDLGWLRSGVRADLGLSGTVSLVARLDTLALDYGISAQNATYAGLRWSPLGDSTVRVSATVEGGLILHEAEVEYAIRGELAVGVVLERLATPYLRFALRGLSFDAGEGGTLARDSEVAAGVERLVGRVIVGAEASLWLRPELDTIPQWRLRAAFPF